MHQHDPHGQTAASMGEERSPDHAHGTPGAAGQGHNHHDHHTHMAADFRRRFFVCLGVTLPILALSPMVREWVGLEGS